MTVTPLTKRIPYKNIAGKPYILVSSKGIINGLSDIINDGADFGPDTPNTQTSGLQEAYNYGASLPTSTYNNNMVIELITPYDNFANFIIDKEIQLGLASSSWVTSGRLGASIIPSSTFSDPYLFNLGSSSVSFENIIFQGGTSSIGYLENSNITTSPFDYHFTKCYFGSSPSTIFNFNLSSDTSRVIFIDSQLTLSGGSTGALGTWGQDGASNNAPIIFIGCDFGIPAGTGFNAGAGSPTIIASYQHGSENSYGSLFNITNTTDMPYLNIIGHQIMDTSTLFNWANTNPNVIQQAYIYGLNQNISNALFTGTYNQGFLSMYGYGLFTDSPLLKKSIPLVTPSVPASGTAQQNTNPYPVKVYVNGGAITEIQITINGTAYTVYSNSTASAVYEGFTLPAGASITLTYTTAPTWEWVPE